MRYLWLLFLFFTFSVFGQANQLKIDGKVTHNGDNVENAKVTLFKDGTEVKQIRTKASGKFEFFLDLEATYEVHFTKERYVTKIIEVDTYGSPSEQAAFGYEFGGWEVTLFKDFPSLDKSVLEGPIGRIHFSEDIMNFDYDIKFIRRKIDEVEKLQEKALELEEEEEKRLAELEDQYQIFLKDGDKAMGREQWEEAKSLFAQAAELKPDESYPLTQLEVIDEKLGQQQETQLQFDNFIDKGDRLLAQQDFQGAKEAFTAAQNLKPKSEKAQQKITQVEEEKRAYEAEQAKQKQLVQEKEARYQDHIATASSALEQGSFKQAKQSAELALAIKPNDTEAKRFLAEAEENLEAREAAAAAEALAEKQAAEKKKAEQEKLAQEARDLEEAGNLQQAKQKYERLLAYNPQERPKYEQKLKAIEQKLITEANREQVFQQEMNEAEVTSQKGDLEGALAQYESIAEQYPEKQEPLDKIAALKASLEKQRQQELAEAQQKAEEEEARRKAAQETEDRNKRLKVNSFISSGDVFFKKKQYEQALQRYRSALELNPDNIDIKKKIGITQTEIDRRLAKIENDDAREKKHADKINIEAEPDEYTDEFLNEIAQQFPEGVTEKVYKQGNKTITKRIVVKGGTGAVYRKVKHSWGGEYYFRNNDPITKFLWDKETVL